MRLRSTRKIAHPRVTARLATALAFAAVASGLLGGGTAQAYEVESGSFAFSGDPGEYISAGQSYAYTDGEGSPDGMTVQGYTSNGVGTGVGVFVDSASGDIWSLHLEAPWGPSQPLVPGTYTGAKANPAPGEPRIELRGNGRDCLAEGSFTIRSVEFATHGYVKSLDASFEQHCPGATESLRGEVRVSNPEPPAETVLGLQVAADGVADRDTGRATVHGTVTCNSPVTVQSYGTVSQTVEGVVVRGSYRTEVACVPGEPTPWTAQATPTGTVPFQRGEATVTARTTGTDPFYGHTITSDYTGTLQLAKR
ncbi:hypothetical protein [Streptomyces chromofuscus]|uniref:Secreted protein n=1 Tax=Streptomyces chromofuscus TaxID=42881 RepID=A0A7M2TGA4_STRCW|nr:hypothetical protein [Streptomyces chromofuscus]QOV47224.1 hypothetical protein IPT68_15910 [Streptomyces chromofuscus]GGT24278.1 hypothetical protein GCM10010254_50850 [Streptomyces chromofuscus]